MPSATACAEAAGITYRQFDHWLHQGYIPTTTKPSGSGNPRVFSQQECAFVVKLAKMVRAGIAPATAAEVLQKVEPDVTSMYLTPEVEVTLHEVTR